MRVVTLIKNLLSFLMVITVPLHLLSNSQTEAHIKPVIQNDGKFEVNPNYIPYDKSLIDSLRNLMDQNKYKEILTSIQKISVDTLLSTYNVGYVLFAVNREKQVIEGTPQIRKGYDIKWDKIKIVDINNENYKVTIGGIHFRTPDNINVKIDDNTYSASRSWGYRSNVISTLGLDIFVETIINSNEGIICLVGLSSN